MRSSLATCIHLPVEEWVGGENSALAKPNLEGTPEDKGTSPPAGEAGKNHFFTDRRVAKGPSGGFIL